MTLLPYWLAFFIALWLTRRLCNPNSRLHLIDHPNERSLHSHPTPRSGGVGLLGGFAAGLSIAVGQWEGPDVRGLLGVLVPAVPIALVSFVDDRSGVQARWRFVVHALAGIMFCLSGPMPVVLGLPGAAVALDGIWMGSFCLVFLVWMTNLYNFMDGMDGFAGGMAVFGFSTFALLSASSGAYVFSASAALIAAAAAGFLCMNFPPARIFMGDTGSATLGFLAGAMTLWAQRDGIFPIWVGLLTFSPFVVDATVTLLRRALQGERFWQPHRTHFYQRLVQLGWGHRRTVLAEYVVMLACSAAALGATRLSNVGQQFLALGAAVIYGLLMIAVTRLERCVGAH